MEQFLGQIYSILTNPSGNLVYHLALALSVLIALQVALTNRPDGGRHLAIGLGILFAAQVVLFTLSGMSWQGVLIPPQLLPPLDRGVAALSLVWVLWLWCFEPPSRLGNVITGLLSLGVFLFLFFTYTAWYQMPGVPFNSSWMDLAWQAFSLFVIAAGLFLLMMHRLSGWGTVLAFLLLNLAGVLVQLLNPPFNGNYAPAVRLVQLCSYPLLPSLALLSPARPALRPSPQAADEAADRRHYTADPRAVYAWLQLSIQTQSQQIFTAVARAIAQTMLADVCYIVSFSDRQDTLVVRGGYDLIEDEELPGLLLPIEKIPTLAGAIQRGRPIRINNGNQLEADLTALAKLFWLERTGNLLYLPLASSSQDIWGGLLLLSPYSNRPWTTEDQTYLIPAVDSILKILMKAAENGRAASAVDREALDEELSRLRQENQRLLAEIEQQRDASQPSTDLEMVKALQKEAQDTIDMLQEENERLRGLQAEAAHSHDATYLEDELHRSLEQVAHLQNALAAANMKIVALEVQPKAAPNALSAEQEVIASIAQELRQPMASIVGYTELLMSETVGILGNLQRKFLERVHTSAHRMDELVNHLMHVISLEGGPVESRGHPVDIAAVIDQAVSEMSPRLADKHINVHVDMVEDLPRMRSNRESLLQILLHLLKNASSVTPSEGTVYLHARQEKDDENHPYLLIQVGDSGEGISLEDLPNVFSSEYRNEHPDIRGVGDNGVGLTLAKSLTTAQGGRIWVDSQNDRTTYSVLIPVQPVEVTPGESPP